MSIYWKTPQHDESSWAAPGDHLRRTDQIHSFRLPQHGYERHEKTISVRFADTGDQRDSACALLNKIYGRRGYGSNHQIAASSMHTTFTASVESEVIGTLTLAVDSPAGLTADKTFSEEIDAFRQIEGAKVCELTRLAFDSDVPSKPLLAAFFHVIFIYGRRKYGCTDLFIEVNPRHVLFYQVMLGFKRIGALKTNDSVAAPSQLMWLKVADIRTHIDAHAGKNPAGVRSLYPYFFSQREEVGISARLAGMAATESAAAFVPSPLPGPNMPAQIYRLPTQQHAAYA